MTPIKTKFKVVVAGDEHHVHATTIVNEMETSAKVRGTGIARRSPEFIMNKMTEGKAVIALTSTGKWAGFCYIESWSHDQFVANSGLIVHPDYRKSGLAKEIKNKIFQLSRKRFPKAKIFGLTTGLAVMKINSEIGYEPVTYQELTNDDAFWNGCRSCVNFPILEEKQRKNCMCTAMLYDPNVSGIKKWKSRRLDFLKHSELYERYMRIKQNTFLNGLFKLNKQKKDHD